MRKIVISLFSLLILFVISGCVKQLDKISDSSASSQNKADTEQAVRQKTDVGNDICQDFTADFVYSATGKAVVQVEPDTMSPKLACRYYFTYDPDFYKDASNKVLSGGGAHIFMMLENLNVAKQKEGVEFLGATTKTDSRIKMENMITVREDGTIWDIKLIINPDRYVRIDYSNKALTDEELISFAAKVAEKIQGNLSFNIKNNPTDIGSNLVKPEEDGISQQSVAGSFLDNLAALKVSEALAMMDANENTKQMWGVNFNTLNSLKVNKIEEAFKEEWTASRQSFKAELDVKVKSEGKQSGWQDGTNYRWITLEKNTNGQWMIHEIANNP